MGEKVKTTIVINRELWEEFRSRVGAERGLRALSQAIEEAIEDEVSELLVVKALEKMLGEPRKLVSVSPIKPKVLTDAGRALRELRESRA